jgi:pimeloyl-ACP methyl ester carboxylesterase
MASSTTSLETSVHTLDEGRGPLTFLLIHGLGGSHLNWGPIVRPLAARGRVLVPDLGGFGRTPPGPQGAGVDANLELVARFVRAASPERPVVAVGNSMGGYLAMRLAAEYPSLVAGAVLVNAAAPIPRGAKVDRAVAAMFSSYLVPGLAPALLRARAAKVGPERMVRDMLALCMANPSAVEAEVLDAHIELARARASLPWVYDAFLEAARSVIDALRRRADYVAAFDGVRAPLLVVHGDRDRLVPVEAARALAARRGDVVYAEAAGIGHMPQLEAPGWLLATIDDWLTRSGLAPTT